ncbi:hypothetical protein [Rubrivirga sp.]|uniref:hypothetical protein n=1 Tax=Rubrivirga sp. TaxID=1885344 RepID=UPI003B523779
MTSPLDLFQARRVAQGVARTDVTVKQAYGRSLAERLGFNPGAAGADGGIDGWLEWDSVRALFFCRLSAKPLGVKDAREFVAVLIKTRATLGLVVSAFAGYAPRFEAEVLDTLAGAELSPSVHLLRLQDVLAETAAFDALRSDLAP